MDSVLRRRKWIVGRLESWKINEIADTLRISERTVDRSWGVYRKDCGRLYECEAAVHDLQDKAYACESWTFPPSGKQSVLDFVLRHNSS